MIDISRKESRDKAWGLGGVDAEDMESEGVRYQRNSDQRDLISNGHWAVAIELVMRCCQKMES